MASTPTLQTGACNIRGAMPARKGDHNVRLALLENTPVALSA